MASFLDEDTSGGGHEGEGEDKGERIDTGENGRGQVDGLEVEGEEVGSGDEDGAVAEAGEERGDVGAALEEAEGHDGVAGYFPFVDEEQADGEEAEDDEANNGGGFPGVVDTAVFEAEKEHDSPANYCCRTEPVNGFETCQYWCFGRLNVQKEHDDEKCYSIKWDFKAYVSSCRGAADQWV